MKAASKYDNSFSFDQYSDLTDFIAKGNHVTVTYTCLGMIGELGEVIEAVYGNLDQHEISASSINPSRIKALELLQDFLALAKEVEKFKKAIRRSQIALLPEVQTSHATASEVVQELGGLLWYLDKTAKNLELNLGHVALANVRLLNRRFSANPEWMIDDDSKKIK